MLKKATPVIREILDWALHIVIAVILALLIVQFVAQRTLVDGNSMLPTLQHNNQLIIEKITPRLNKIKPGDIVAVYIESENKDYIKRVIAVGGDDVEIKDGKVYVNNTILQENYINGNNTDVENQEYCKMKVPEGFIYVLGDNRLPKMSNDSRSIGPVAASKVEGRAILRYWPISEFGLIK
jgi:signal peptidase I